MLYAKFRFALIQFDDVSLAFAGHPLFKNVSFSLQEREKCGLVGRNGSGKSTLLKLITHQLEADRGNIAIPRDYRIGYLEQHIQFTKPTLLEEAATSLPPDEELHLYKAEKILFGLGFTKEDLDTSPDQFSGGFHLRLHLAKVLISEPDCLLLDEPTNYLDILSIRWLTQFLKKWKGEFILVSHDRDFMDQVTTHTMGIHREGVKEMKGSTIDFFEQLVIEEEVHEKTRVKIEKKKAHAQKYIERYGAKATKAAQAQSRKKQTERLPVMEKLKDLAHLSFNFQEMPFPGRKMLEARNLYFSYTEDPLIQKVSLSIERGQRIAIIGKNGRGKSIILRLLAQDLKQDQGTLKISENTHFGYFGQTNISRLHPNHTIEEEISAANPRLTYTQVKNIAGIMMFSGDLSAKRVSVLSGGERSRVLLGKILAKPCNLLLLDEPTHHLDIESIEALMDAIEDFSGSVIIVTHSELILRRFNPDQIVICEEGHQDHFLGNYDEFLEKVGWEEEKKNTPPKKKNKQERAQFVQDCAKVLRPIEKQIQSCEKKIISLEEEQTKEQILIEEGKQTPEIIKSMGRRIKEIEQLYSDLEELHEKYEREKKSFQ